MQAQVDNTGLKATPVNPYAGRDWSDYNDNTDVLIYQDWLVELEQYAATHPERSLTTPQEANSVIEVSEVKQTMYVHLYLPPRYIDVSDEEYIQCQEYNPHKTRIAYKPTAPPTPESDNGEGLEEELSVRAANIFKRKYSSELPTDQWDGFKKGYPNGFYDGYNAAIEDAVKLLKGAIISLKDDGEGGRADELEIAVYNLNQLRK